MYRARESEPIARILMEGASQPAAGDGEQHQRAAGDGDYFSFTIFYGRMAAVFCPLSSPHVPHWIWLRTRSISLCVSVSVSHPPHLYSRPAAFLPCVLGSL